MKQHRFNAIASIIFSLLLTGCATTAPTYQPDFGSVNMMKNQDMPKMHVGAVTMESAKLEKVTLRGGTMSSPYGDYAGYFKYAIEEQLKQGDVFNSNSGIELSCVITRNDLDGSGSSTGTADLAGSFTAKDHGRQIYNKSLSIHHEWPSSFVGAIAIPNAQQGYSAAVQKLVDALFSDKNFINAINQHQ